MLWPALTVTSACVRPPPPQPGAVAIRTPVAICSQLACEACAALAARALAAARHTASVTTRAGRALAAGRTAAGRV